MSKKLVHENCLFNQVNVNYTRKPKKKLFIEIISSANFDSKNNHTLATWPKTKPQDGPMCGIITFFLGVISSKDKDKPQIQDLLLRKRDGKPEKTKFDEKFGVPILDLEVDENVVFKIKREEKAKPSLREMFKGIGATEFGPIYNVNHFATMAKRLKISNCEVLNLPDTEEKYIAALCGKIRAGNFIIIACEVFDSFPSVQNGLHTHWAGLFEWIYLNDQIYFLVDQHGEYYLWSGHDLFESNHKLPSKNPKYGTYSKQGRDIYTETTSLSLSIPGKKNYHIADMTLKNFRFKGFSMELYDKTSFSSDIKLVINPLIFEQNITNIENLKKYSILV